VDKQKSEGLVSAMVDFGMTAFNVRLRQFADVPYAPAKECYWPIPTRWRQHARPNNRSMAAGFCQSLA
jgi:hypothetical protein